MIEVYDSTTSDDADKTDELVDSVTISLTIDNVDDIAPSIHVAPFGELYNESDDDAAKSLQPVTDYEDNVAMSGDTRLGHVEYASDSRHDNGVSNGDGTDDDADISGSVIFRGKAEDNQNISRITATIPGYDGGNGAGVAFDIYNTASGGALSDADWAFTIDGSEYLTDANGNVFNWSFQWDSATVANAVADNATLTVTVYDSAATPNNAAGSLTVDIVPYISSLVRDAPDPVPITRTRFGRYPLPEGVQNLTINGFNLDVRSTNSGWVRLYNAGGTASTDLAYADGDVAADFTSVTVDFGVGVQYSGELRLNVDTTTSLNNRNDNTLPQNIEADTSYEQHSDDRYILLWQVDNEIQNSAEAEHGALNVDRSDGTPTASWSEYSGSDAFYGTAGGRTQIFGSFDPPEWTDIDTNDSGTPYVVYLANFFGNQNQYDYGGLVLWSNNADYYYSTDPNDDYRRYYDYIEEIEYLGNDQKLYQFRNPRMVVSGADGDTDIYVSYYDAHSKALKFGHMYDNGTDIYNHTLSTAINGTTNDPVGSPDNDEHLVDGDADPSLGDDVGLYSDIDVDENGYPVIVYYDTTNQTLKLARATSQDPTNHATDWSIQDVFDPGDPRRQYSGQYVSVKIDSSGNVHVAAYRTSTGDLIYLYAPQANPGTDYTFQTSELVDEAGAVGAWAEIDLLSTAPYIGYLDSSAAGTFQGAKFAYRTASGWEFGTVPAEVAVESGRISAHTLPSGVTPTAANDYELVIGYTAVDYYFARLRPEQ